MIFTSKKKSFFSTAWLPNSVTYLNLFSGFLAILMIIQNQLTHAAWLVLFAMVCDSLDGNIARALKNSNDFGRELDSLADMVSFVVVPPLLVCKSWPTEFSQWALLVAFTYLACGSYRLARFNVRPPVKSFFEGLPTPAAAVLLAMTVVIYQKNEWSGFFDYIFDHGILMLIASVLMVSRIPYPKFSAIKFSKWKFFFYLAFIIFAITCVQVNPETAVGSVFFLFLVLAPIVFSISQGIQKKKELAAQH